MSSTTPCLTPLVTDVAKLPLSTSYDADMTPTSSTPQAGFSPHLTTPDAGVADSISPNRKGVRKQVVVTRSLTQDEEGMVSAETLPSSTRLQHKLIQLEVVKPTHISQKGPTISPIRNEMFSRRQSGFDPMMRDGDDTVEDGGYGDLGQKHPLRRVLEHEDSDVRGKSHALETDRLPGIKSLFGVASDHPTTPASSALFQSPSLPSLTPNSPSSSPNSARTSRYPSLASSAVPESQTGWWAPDFGAGSGSPFSSTPFRSNSFPTLPYTSEEPGQKRRRSDGPPATRDAEESARLRWQAQSRNASYPLSATPGEPYASANGPGLRGLLHPPLASSAAISASMSRTSFSGSTSATRLSPTLEDSTLPPLIRQSISTSRNPSLVGGQLSKHFADLSASDRRVSTSSPDMLPPLQSAPPERRASMLPPISAVDDSRLLAPPTSLSRASSPGSDSLRRHSLTRPPSPDGPPRPELRRSSLTEIIMAKSGDSLTMTKGRFHPPPSEIASVAMEKPSVSEPGLPMSSHRGPPFWSAKRESVDSMGSAAGLTETEGPLLSLRGRKRSAADIRKADEEDTEMQSVDPAMRGMEVLVAAAEEEERKGRKSSEEDREGSPSQVTGVGGGPKYTCAFCAKTFSRPSSLRIHTYSHTGERPYVCKEPSCRRRFSVQSNLKRHAKVHQLGAAGQQNGVAAHPHPHHPNGQGLGPMQSSHPGMMQSHPGMPRGPIMHSGPGPHSNYHPQPPTGYYPPPGYGPTHAHPHAHPHPHPGQAYPMYPDPRFGPLGPPGIHSHPGQPPVGYGSTNSSRRTSRDGDWSGEEEGEGDEEEEIDELDELDEED